MGLPKSVIGVDKWVRYGASSKGTEELLLESYGRSWTEMERGGVEGGKSELTERERERERGARYTRSTVAGALS